MEKLLGKYYETHVTSLVSDDDGGVVDPSRHYSVTVNALDLFNTSADVGQLLLSQPSSVLAACDTVLHKVLSSIGREHGKPFNSIPMSQVHIRFCSLPACPELHLTRVPQTKQLGQLLAISGTVARTTVVKVLECSRDYQCSNCHRSFSVTSDLEQYNTIPKPPCCTYQGCGSVKIEQVEDEGEMMGGFRDYQEVKVQEQVQKLEVGKIPRSMWVILKNDLVDSCKAGDDVTITGIVRRRWKPVSVGQQCVLEIVLLGNHVQVNSEHKMTTAVNEEMKIDFDEFWRNHGDRRLEGRNVIISSFCPQVFGLYIVKLAVFLALIGGVEHVDVSGTRVRGESHILLVGDPGTGKSQVLKYAVRLVQRSVLTTGLGCTSAGLTVAAVKDGGEWQLEAGALVLADGGLCCIDEFSSIQEHDRGSIHEAMEQQTISVAKAGLVCKLNTKCTILAATNPKGRYNTDESLSVNVALASPLLSRFDLVLILLDSQNETWDHHISSFILNNASHGRKAGKREEEEQEEQEQEEEEEKEEGEEEKEEGGKESVWSVEKMRAYLRHVKSIKPAMTRDANIVLSHYYQYQRQTDSRNVARTTIRLLESLVRIAQAHARLMCNDEVTLMDAVIAVSVMECSMSSSALLGGVNILHSAFPDNPDLEYSTQKRLILEKLGLLDKVDDTEMGTVRHGMRTEQHGLETTPSPPPTKRHCSRGSFHDNNDDLDLTRELL